MRLQSFDPGLYEALGVTIDPPRVVTDDSGFAVALATARYPLVLDADPDTGRAPRPGQLIQRWEAMLYRLQFPFLAPNLD